MEKGESVFVCVCVKNGVCVCVCERESNVRVYVCVCEAPLCWVMMCSVLLPCAGATRSAEHVPALLSVKP